MRLGPFAVIYSVLCAACETLVSLQYKYEMRAGGHGAGGGRGGGFS